MSDFLLSTDPADAPRLSTLLTALGHPDASIAAAWQCPFAAVAITTTPYHGLAPIDDDGKLVWVLGDPLLAGPLTGAPATCARTAALAASWRTAGAGLEPRHPAALCRLDRHTGELEIIIDAIGAVPIYLGVTDARLVLGSSPDLVAALIGAAVDPVSGTELLCNRRICFPHTLYAGVRQLRPGASHRFRLATPPDSPPDNRHRAVPWWTPPAVEDRPAREWSTIIRAALVDSLEAIAAQVGNAGSITLSGGLDTRWLAALAAPVLTLEAVCVTDGENVERRVARQIAARVGMAFRGLDRAKGHYARLLLGRPIWASSQNLWHHAHFIGLDLAASPRLVLGGYGADTALKRGETSFRARTMARAAGRLPAMAPPWQIEAWPAGLLSAAAAATIDARYAELARILERQGEDLAEAYGIWPFTQRGACAHFHANRRTMPAYEPFLSRTIADLAFRLPASMKEADITGRSAAPDLAVYGDIPVNAHRRGLIGFIRRIYGGRKNLDRIARWFSTMPRLRAWYSSGAWTPGFETRQDAGLQEAASAARQRIGGLLDLGSDVDDALNVRQIAALLQIDRALEIGRHAAPPAGHPSVVADGRATAARPPPQPRTAMPPSI
jgi:hypothetical protein